MRDPRFLERHGGTLIGGAVAALLAGYGAVAVLQFAVRIAYPWDILTCFETPFLNAMLRLQAGQGLYAAPATASSEVYPPAMHHLAWLALSPFGVALDVRFLRLFGFAVGTVAALIAGDWLARVVRSIEPDAFAQRRWHGAALAATWLALSRNMTFDAPHPDNLHALHAALVGWLTWRALCLGRFDLALAASVVAGLGVLTKQTALLAPVAAAAALLVGRSWGPRGVWLGVAGPALTIALVLALDQGDRGYHLFHAMADHEIALTPAVLATPFLDGNKLSPLLFPPRIVLLFSVLPALAHLTTTRPGRLFVLTWAAIGLLEVAPALVAFVKIGGNFNNWGVVDLWLFLAGAAALATAAARWLPDVAVPVAARLLLVSLILYLAASLYPLAMRPGPDAWDFGWRVERAVGDALRAGKTLWVPTGAAFLVRNGVTTPLENLGVAVWTAEQSGRDDLRVRDAIARAEFDAVFFMFPWRLRVREALARTYERIGRIEGVAYGEHNDQRGIQPYLTFGCEVWERKAREG